MSGLAGFGEVDRDSVLRAGRIVASIEGMWCASCAMAVERIILRVPGVLSASASFAGGSALIRWDPAIFSLDELLSRVERLGYRLVPLLEADEVEARIDAQARAVWLRLAVAVFFGMWSMLGSLALYLDAALARAPQGWWIALGACIAALPVVTYSAWAFHKAGWRTLRAGVPGMDALVALGVLSSCALSAWRLAQGSAEVYVDTATMLVGFMLCGRLIELHARRRNSATVRALQQAVPETARRIAQDGGTSEVPAAQVHVAEEVLVHAGERIAVDGTVTEGESTVDRSIVTGESAPMAVTVGSSVEAGCVNLSCAIRIRVDRPYGQRFVDRIGLRMLELFGAKSSVALQAERFARLLTPSAIVLAAIVFALGWYASGDTAAAALRALSVLVAACPCAVGLALPLAYAASVGSAARHGILFRDPASMEALALAGVVHFDKTGTLTEGDLSLVDVVCPGRHRSEVLHWAALAEEGIAHPVARAIRKAIAQSDVGKGSPTGKAIRHARGVEWHGGDGAHAVLVGSAAWLAGRGVPVPGDLASGLRDSARMRVEVALDGRWIGALHFQDAVRRDAAKAIAAFERAGVTTELVTGDSAAAAMEVAWAVGLAPEQVHASCQPEDKLALVGHARRPLVFVGDGINDALALAAADCGIAVHGASTAAVATAGVVITAGGLEEVVSAWRHARRTLRIVRQNLLFSMLYNVGVLILASATNVPPLATAAAMLASSVSVTMNAARLSRFVPMPVSRG